MIIYFICLRFLTFLNMSLLPILKILLASIFLAILSCNSLYIVMLEIQVNIELDIPIQSSVISSFYAFHLFISPCSILINFSCLDCKLLFFLVVSNKLWTHIEFSISIICCIISRSSLFYINLPSYIY